MICIQSLLELTTLLSDSDTPDRAQHYSLLLELFLSVEDGRYAAKGDGDLKILFTNFQNFASTVMMTDLANSAGINNHETILQIIALCFSNIDQWEKKSLPCLGKLLSAVCQVIMNADIHLLSQESKGEEIILTALFSLDHSMPILAFKQRHLLAAVFCNILQSSNKNKLTRIYGYRALATFLTDILSSDHEATRDMIMISSMKILFMQDLIHIDLGIREATLLCLQCLPVACIKQLHDYSNGSMRTVLSSLRWVDTHILK